jgi:hypothetical protein
MIKLPKYKASLLSSIHLKGKQGYTLILKRKAIGSGNVSPRGSCLFNNILTIWLYATIIQFRYISTEKEICSLLTGSQCNNDRVCKHYKQPRKSSKWFPALRIIITRSGDMKHLKHCRTHRENYYRVRIDSMVGY